MSTEHEYLQYCRDCGMEPSMDEKKFNAFIWRGYLNALDIIDTIWYQSFDGLGRYVDERDIAMRSHNTRMVGHIAGAVTGWLFQDSTSTT